MAETGGHHAVINGSARTYHTGCCFRAAGEGRVVGQGAGGSAWCVSASASVLIGVFASARGGEKNEAFCAYAWDSRARVLARKSK